MDTKKTDRILSQKKSPAKNQKQQFDVVVHEHLWYKLWFKEMYFEFASVIQLGTLRRFANFTWYKLWYNTCQLQLQWLKMKTCRRPHMGGSLQACKRIRLSKICQCQVNKKNYQCQVNRNSFLWYLSTSLFHLYWLNTHTVFKLRNRK